jgi:hypothetical protein
VTVKVGERDYDELDEDLSIVARSLHREWHSPGLWPSIVAGIRANDQLALHADGAHFEPFGSFLKCVLVTKS